jgi:HemY protein
MRLVVFALIILSVAAIATLSAIEDPGYVLISRAPWSIEMPLTLFVPLVLLGYFALYLVLFAIVRLWRIPRDVARWRARRHAREGRAALIRGFTHLAEGSWVEAEAALLLSQRHGDALLLSHLGAAIAAQGQGNAEKRDEYLAQAHRQAPQNDLAIGVVQAYLQHLAQQREQSLATLANLHREHPRHKYVLQLLALVYSDLRDWTGLIELLPELRRTQALPTAEIEALELKAQRELLTQSLPQGSLDVLARAWNAVPKTLRRHPTLIAIHARQLLAQDDMKQAEAELRIAIETAWDDTLVALYGELQGEDVTEYLEVAEGWLASHPGNARLLLTLGRLAARAGQQPKARQYLEQSAAREPSVTAGYELGMLLERLGESEAAIAAYRRGLESCLEGARPATARLRLTTRQSPAR